MIRLGMRGEFGIPSWGRMEVRRHRLRPWGVHEPKVRRRPAVPWNHLGCSHFDEPIRRLAVHAFVHGHRTVTSQLASMRKAPSPGALAGRHEGYTSSTRDRNRQGIVAMPKAPGHADSAPDRKWIPGVRGCDGRGCIEHCAFPPASPLRCPEWSTGAGGARVARYSTLREGRCADTGDGLGGCHAGRRPVTDSRLETAESMDTPSRGRMLFRSDARASTGGDP
jgi:hypothetical protein